MADLEIFGEKFRPSGEPPSEFALMEFAEALDEIEENAAPGLAACMRLLRQAIHPDDWARFRTAARKHRAKVDELLPVALSAFQDAVDRPTGPPSDSSDGQEDTEVSSTGDSSLRVIHRLEHQGRPDLALQVLRTQEWQAG